MAGNSEGGRRAAETHKQRDPDHFRKIALLAQQSWERNGRKPRGFATLDPVKHREVSARGGAISRRKSKKGQ